MNFDRLINEASRTTPEGFIRRRINQFKSQMLTSIIITVLALGIIVVVVLYVVFMVLKNIH